jgi:hypothetical protein
VVFSGASEMFAVHFPSGYNIDNVVTVSDAQGVLQ